jgi:cytochrome oxidase Cu insertion factor (SCO1/SenC/PrrC family)
MGKPIWAASLLLATAGFGQEYRLGSKVGDFSLNARKGDSVPFSALRGETTVLMFIATRCPVSNGYNDRMNAVFEEYSAKGVKFVFVNSNYNEPAAEVEEHAKSHLLLFPVYKAFGCPIKKKKRTS